MASPNSPAATMTSSSSQTQAPVEKPSPPPVNILPSQVAQIYSFAHPALLIGLYAFRFQALVADPVQELLADLPWLALLQVTYVLLCLPPAGAAPIAESSTSDGKASSRSSSGRSGKPGFRKKHSSGKNVWTVVWSRLMVRIKDLSFKCDTDHLIANVSFDRTNLLPRHAHPCCPPRTLRRPVDNPQY